MHKIIHYILYSYMKLYYCVSCYRVKYIFKLLLKCSGKKHFFFCIHKMNNWIKTILTKHRILIFCFVIISNWLYSFTHSKINFLPYASLLRSLGFILSPLQDWISTIRFVVTVAWFHSFTRPKIVFLPYASLLPSLDFIASPAPRLNFYHTLGFISSSDPRLNFYHLTWFHLFFQYHHNGKSLWLLSSLF